MKVTIFSLFIYLCLCFFRQFIIVDLKMKSQSAQNSQKDQEGKKEDIQQKISLKLAQLFATQKQDWERKDIDKLAYLYAAYIQEVQFYQKLLEQVNQQNAQLKVREIQLENQVTELRERLSGQIQEGRQKQPYKIIQQSRYIRANDQNQDELLKLFKSLEAELQNQRNQYDSLKQELTRIESQKSAISDQLNLAQRQTEQKRQNEDQYKQQLNSLKKQLQKFKQQSKRNLQYYKEKIMIEFKEQITRNENQQIKQLQKEKEFFKQSIKDIISAVNKVMLSCNKSILEELNEGNILDKQQIQAWIQRLKLFGKKFEKEINKIVQPRFRTDDKNLILKAAQLQKQKIAAKRMYLMKNVILPILPSSSP